MPTVISVLEDESPYVRDKQSRGEPLNTGPLKPDEAGEKALRDRDAGK